MTNFRLVSILTGLSSVLLASLLALRSRANSAPDSEVGGQSNSESQESSPSWPPPEDMYWGM